MTEVPETVTGELSPDGVRPEQHSAFRRPLPPLALRWVLALALAKVSFHIATSAVYGLHRDEFYYLAAGQHPALGYVDQPPVTPLLYRLSAEVFGASAIDLHVIPALAGGALVVLGALGPRAWRWRRSSRRCCPRVSLASSPSRPSTRTWGRCWVGDTSPTGSPPSTAHCLRASGPRPSSGAARPARRAGRAGRLSVNAATSCSVRRSSLRRRSR